MLPSQLLLTQGGTTAPPEPNVWAAGWLPIEEGFGGANRASTQCTPLPGAQGGGLTLSLSVSNTEAAHGTQWAGAVSWELGGATVGMTAAGWGNEEEAAAEARGPALALMPQGTP